MTAGAGVAGAAGAIEVGFSGTAPVEGGAVTGRVVAGGVTQALRSSNAAITAKLDWFFIAIWLKLHLANIQQARKYVGISAGSSSRSVITDPHCLVDQAAEKE